MGTGRDRFARDSDAALLVRAANGDRRAAARLVRTHTPRILGLARRMLRDEAEAEDVTQETFIRLWRMAPDWTPGRARLSTWIHRVALNLCYDRLRKPRPVDGEPPDAPDEGPSAEQSIHARELAQRVREAVDRLPPRQRAAIALCHYEEMGNIEAAEVLEVSVEALESLLSRGRRALREALSGEAGHWLESMEG